MKKITHFFLSIFFWIFATPYCLVVGILLGIIGKTVGAIENIIREIRYQYTHWRRHPNRQKKFWYFQNKSMLMRELQKATGLEHERIQKKIYDLNDRYRAGDAPVANPIPYAFYWALVYLTLLPFSIIAGTIEGPGVMFSDAIHVWKRHILGDKNRSKFDTLIHMLTEQDYIDEDAY